MILTVLNRWRAVWMHLARDTVGGIGFFLVMMGLLLSGDTTFCVYIFSLGIFLSFDRQRIAPAEENDMAIPLFGLMLTLVSGGPFADGMLFRAFMLPVGCALFVAGWIFRRMINSQGDVMRAGEGKRA